MQTLYQFDIFIDQSESSANQRLDANNILLLLNYSNNNPTKCNDDVNSEDEEKSCTDKIKTDTTISIVLPVVIISIDDANVTQNSVEKKLRANQDSAHNAMSNKE